MGYDDKPNGSDFTIVTDVLLHGVFATDYCACNLEAVIDP